MLTQLVHITALGPEVPSIGRRQKSSPSSILYVPVYLRIRSCVECRPCLTDFRVWLNNREGALVDSRQRLDIEIAWLIVLVSSGFLRTGGYTHGIRQSDHLEDESRVLGWWRRLILLTVASTGWRMGRKPFLGLGAALPCERSGWWRRWRCHGATQPWSDPPVSCHYPALPHLEGAVPQLPRWTEADGVTPPATKT